MSNETPIELALRAVREALFFQAAEFGGHREDTNWSGKGRKTSAVCKSAGEHLRLAIAEIDRARWCIEGHRDAFASERLTSWLEHMASDLPPEPPGFR